MHFSFAILTTNAPVTAGVNDEDSKITQFHVYLDGKPTKEIFDTLESAQEGYKEEALAGQGVEIKTVNSPSPVNSWYYDKSINPLMSDTIWSYQ